MSNSKFKIQNSKFYKAHGLGNDYIVLEAGAFPFELTPPVVRLICDRHRGVGSDGILVRVPSSEAEFGLRIYNPDGSEAEKSGNGLRIFAAYLKEGGWVEGGSEFTIETKGGIVTAALLGRSPEGEELVEVDMGKASFRSGAVGLQGPDREVDGEVLELPSGERVAIEVVSMGNPHCVCFEDDLVVEEMRRRAPLISTHPWFANGTNVQFARISGPADIEAFVWERGAGETMASGSSACAVAAAAVRRGLVQQHSVQVWMPGGVLRVTVDDDWEVRLRGPVESVYLAEPTPGLLRRLEALS